MFAFLACQKIARVRHDTPIDSVPAAGCVPAARRRRLHMSESNIGACASLRYCSARVQHEATQ